MAHENHFDAEIWDMVSKIYRYKDISGRLRIFIRPSVITSKWEATAGDGNGLGMLPHQK